jgi:glucose uptake protein GlcU
MKRWKQLIMTLAIVAGVGMAVAPTDNVSAITLFSDCQGKGSTEVCKAANTDDATDMTKKIINTLLFVLGIIAVIMIVIGGIKYTASNGDASRVKSAKDTVMYSVIGLIVAIFAYAIVNFVVTQF